MFHMYNIFQIGVINMRKWIAILKDGSKIEEGQKEWIEIKDNISYLYYDNNGQFIYLPKNAEKYEQSKTASANISNGQIQIETRNIWAKVGNNIVRIRINEKTNNINLEIE